ncbi:hypothetical protein AA313_de0209748 [Arthrobotrys entomopaga]|nr:hypothetical protein AA313_de0209748 [Arthrobotrys entomopaga]
MSSLLSSARKAAVCRLLKAAADFAGQFDELQHTAEQVRVIIEQTEQLTTDTPATADDEDPVVDLLDVAIDLVTSVIVPSEMRTSEVALEKEEEEQEEQTDMTATESTVCLEPESNSDSQPASVMADDEEEEEGQDAQSGFHTSSDMALSDIEQTDSEIPVTSGATLSSSTRWEDWDDDDDEWVPGILKVTPSTSRVTHSLVTRPWVTHNNTTSELDHALVPELTHQGDADDEKLSPGGGDEEDILEGEDSYEEEEEYNTAEEEFGSQFLSADEYDDEYEDEYYTYGEEDADVGEYYHDDSQVPDNYDEDYEFEEEGDNTSQITTSSYRSLTADEIRDPNFVSYWQDNFGQIQKFFGQPGEFWDGSQWVYKDGFFYDRHPFTPQMSKYERLTMNFNSITMGNGGAPGRFPPAGHASSQRGYQGAAKVNTAEIGRQMRAKLQEWKEEEEQKLVAVDNTPKAKESSEVQVELEAPPTTDTDADANANTATTTVEVPLTVVPTTDIDTPSMDTPSEQEMLETDNIEDKSIEPSNVVVTEVGDAWGEPGLPATSVATDEVDELRDAGPQADLPIAHTLDGGQGACNNNNSDYGLHDLVFSASFETVQDTGSQMGDGLELVRVASHSICLSETHLEALLDSHDGDRIMESHVVDSSSASGAVEHANDQSVPAATTTVTPPTTPNTSAVPPPPPPSESEQEEPATATQAPMTPLEYLVSRGLHKDRLAEAGSGKKRPIKNFIKTACKKTMNSSSKMKLKVPWKSVLKGMSRAAANVVWP